MIKVWRKFHKQQRLSKLSPTISVGHQANGAISRYSSFTA
jgi:hypothetical protein